MTYRLSTDICPLVIPDTYGTNFCYYVADEMWDSFKQLLIDKAEEFIKDALKEINLDAKVIMGEFGSPREYNFSTDWIDFDIELPDNFAIEVNDDFFEYAKKFGSHPGFVSFYPTTPNELMKSKRTDLILSMYILWLFEKENDLEQYQKDYLYEVEDYAQGNGYFEDEEDAI